MLTIELESWIKAANNPTEKHPDHTGKQQQYTPYTPRGETWHEISFIQHENIIRMYWL